MRTIFKKLIFLPCLFALISCHEERKESIDFTIIEHSYDEIKEYAIGWNDIFCVNESNYLVYFYSETCSHCNNIKNQVIEYALNPKLLMYFLKFSQDVVVSGSINHTIGATSINDLAILGTPTLIDIQDKKVISNVAGEKAVIDYLETTSSKLD